MAPFIDTIDQFQLTNPYAPYLVAAFGLGICYLYPSVKVWNTSRRDTTIITGTVVGFSIGSYLSNYSGYMQKPDQPPLYDIILPESFNEIVCIVTRTLLGFAIILSVRNFFKAFILRTVCLLCGYDINDPLVKQRKMVELCYCFFTYLMMGASMNYLTPMVFRYFDIERNTLFTEW
jgi:hypothetical protein